MARVKVELFVELRNPRLNLTYLHSLQGLRPKVYFYLLSYSPFLASIFFSTPSHISHTQIMAALSEKSDKNEITPSPGSATRRELDPKKKHEELIISWYMVTLHLVACVAFAIFMIYGVDGYKALDSTSGSRYSNKPGGGWQYVLRPSDVQTIIGYFGTTVNALISAWSATVVMRCAFAELEGREGLTVKQFNAMFTWPNIPPLSSLKWRRGVVLLILLLTIPQPFMTPIVTGSVNWGSAFEERAVASGNPDAHYNRWYWWGEKLQDRQAGVKKAAGMANLAWETTHSNPTNNTSARQTRCRHVVNNDGNPANSRLSNVVMPCIVFHDIHWPTVPAPEIVSGVAEKSTMVSLTVPEGTSTGGPFSFVNYPGNAILFDQTNTTLRRPYTDRLKADNVGSVMPAPFMFSGKMTVIVLVGKEYWGSDTTDGFGYAKPNNLFTTSSSGGQLHFTYLEVFFTVGIATSPRNTYLSSQVVEADQELTKINIEPGPWVLEALYLLPDVMSTVAIMNATSSLNTWQNIHNYTENLVRFSYQGAWDMLQRSFDPNTTVLTASIRDHRVQAAVTLVRVWAWLAASTLMSAAAVVLCFLIRRCCDRNIVVDGPLALLLSDPTELFAEVEREHEGSPNSIHLTNLAVLTKDTENIVLRLEEVRDESSGERTGIFKLRQGHRNSTASNCHTKCTQAQGCGKGGMHALDCPQKELIRNLLPKSPESA